MKDFGQWFNDFKPVSESSTSDAAQKHIDYLENAGVINSEADGSFTAQCCRCGDWTELPVDPEEINLGYTHWCGGSPLCCP